MKKTQTTLIILSFASALILYLFDLTKIVYAVDGRTIQIYPAAFFALIGVWLLLGALIKIRTGQ